MDVNGTEYDVDRVYLAQSGIRWQLALSVGVKLRVLPNAGRDLLASTDGPLCVNLIG
jgi:hypothetical protein